MQILSEDDVTTTAAGELSEIQAIARADHAYRLPRDYNPYPAGSDKARAWDAGWDEEDQMLHRLDEEVVKLPQFRVRVEIVAGDAAGGDVLATIDREELSHYSVSQMRSVGHQAVSYDSPEARAAFADKADVRVRVTYEGQGGMFD